MGAIFAWAAANPELATIALQLFADAFKAAIPEIQALSEKHANDPAMFVSEALLEIGARHQVITIDKAKGDIG